MGIKGLGSYLKKHIVSQDNVNATSIIDDDSVSCANSATSTKIVNGCLSGISRVNLSMFNGKRIAIDFTNQLYRFLYRSENENSYLLEFINLTHKFKKNGINIIYVFDGKPIIEKNYVIEHRKAFRDKLLKKIDELNENFDESEEIQETIKYLSKKTKGVNITHVKTCKELFNTLGIPFIHIENIEADLILKYLLESNQVDACFTGDMDALAFGCHTIIQDLDFRNDTVQCIKFNELINSMELTKEQFLYICILSGTDYNNSLRRTNFEINMELIKKYNTIENIINNLDEINAPLPEEYKKSCPTRFNWQNTINIYTESISETAKDEIRECLEHFTNFRHKLKKEKVEELIRTINKFEKKINAKISFKYSNKIVDFINWEYNISISRIFI